MIDHINSTTRLLDRIASICARWEPSNLIWGALAGHGAEVEQRSAVDGSVIQLTRMLDDDELHRLLADDIPKPIGTDQVQHIAERLHMALRTLRPALLETMQLETGFIRRDCEELIEGTLEYVRAFPSILEQHDRPPAGPFPYALTDQTRRIRLTHVPWGTIAIVLPQNAFLLIAVTALLNALATGNRIILRAPQQSARSAALLAVAIQAANEPSQAISVVLVNARVFVEALCRSKLPALIHYMGSSQHAPQILSDGFRHSKPVLVDGSGNTWVWVGADVPAETAAQLLTQGAIRYNGQTCTSINGAMIHPALYADVRQMLIERWKHLTAGNPLTTDVDVGPLFDETQASWCAQLLGESGGTILCGGTRTGNLLTPTLVEHPKPESALVCEGIFGNGLWIAPGDREDFIALWRNNRYPLCAGVLSTTVDANWWLRHLPNLARLTINGDPSVEYIFEPWGGYPTSGTNPVSIWHEKYQRVVALDERVE